MAQSQSSVRGYSFALTSAAVLSTTAVFIRYLTQAYDLAPLVLALWRNVFTVVTLVAVLGVRWPNLLRISKSHLPYLISYGLVLAAFNSMWTLSVALNGAAVATVLVYCSGAFTALLGALWLKETISTAKLLAIVVSLAGCFLVSGASTLDALSSNGLGILTGVASGLSYALYSLFGRVAAQRGLNPWTTLVYTFASAALFLLVLNVLPVFSGLSAAGSAVELLWLEGSAFGWATLLLLAAGPTVVGFGLYNVSLTYLPASVVNLVATLEPVFTALIAFVLLGELLSLAQTFGAILILAAVALLRMFDYKKEVQPERGQALCNTF